MMQANILAYLNFILGVLCMFAFIPVQTWFYRRDREKKGGRGRPEARFITSLVFVSGFPISLLWFAFTSSGNVSYWSPIVAGGLLVFYDPLLGDNLTIVFLATQTRMRLRPSS